MRHFPIFLDLNDRCVLVVGGRETAARKVRLLRDAGARITVVAPNVEPELAALVEAGSIRHVAERFRADFVAGFALVFATTDVEAVDRAVVEAAGAAGIHANATDRPKLSTFILPAIVDRDPITVAVSSAGTAPVLARSVRAQMEAALPANLGRVARFADRYRGAVKASIQGPERRRRFWECFFRGPLAAAVLAGDERWATDRMLAAVNRSKPPEAGRAAVVGAGPGDPEMLTLGALRDLQDADAIVREEGVPGAVLACARRDAVRTDAPAGDTDLIELLTAAVRRDLRVVWLVKGDAISDPRVRHVAAAVRQRGVRVDLNPGVAAPAVPAIAVAQ